MILSGLKKENVFILSSIKYPESGWFI